MKSMAIAAALLFLLAAPALGQDKNPCPCPERIGFVDLQRLLAESPQGLSAGAGYQKELDAKKADLEKRFQEVERLRILLENEGPRMSEDRRSDLIMQYDRTASEYEGLARQTQQEMSEKNARLITDVLKEADPIMRDIAQKRDFSMVLKDPMALGYLNPRVDITEDVLKAMKVLAGKKPASR